MIASHCTYCDEWFDGTNGRTGHEGCAARHERNERTTRLERENTALRLALEEAARLAMAQEERIAELKTAKWIDGPPPYSESTKGPHRDRAVWLRLHDQSGYPFPVVAWLYGGMPATFVEENKAWLAWLKSGRVGERPKQSPLIPSVRIPELKTDKPVADLWNLLAHMEIATPAQPGGEE